MKNLSFENLPKAIEYSLEKLIAIEEELKIKKTKFSANSARGANDT